MLIAMIVHPPAFGMKLKSVDVASAKDMPGIKDIFPIKVYNDDYEWQYFDTCTFNGGGCDCRQNNLGSNECQKNNESRMGTFCRPPGKKKPLRGDAETATVPAGLESTTNHLKMMEQMQNKPGTVERKDGDIDTAFKNAAQRY